MVRAAVRHASQCPLFTLLGVLHDLAFHRGVRVLDQAGDFLEALASYQRFLNRCALGLAILKALTGFCKF